MSKLDKPREACGIAAAFGDPEASKLVYLMLYALQHRGQEGAGIVSTGDGDVHIARGVGVVADVFTHDVLAGLPGTLAIGHTRYSTTGSSVLKNAQPLAVDYARGSLSVAHNGNLVNAEELKHELEDYGSIFQTTVDTEVLIHLISRSPKKQFLDALASSLEKVQGAYCLLIQHNNTLVAARDPHGFRPLAMGKLREGWVFASETCAFDLIGAQYVRDVEPGEMVVVENGMVQTRRFAPAETASAFCVFENIYFSRPDSHIFGTSCWEARQMLGRILARESLVPADIVIPVPDSGVCAAIGFAQEAKLPFEMSLIRNHYVGRTFIEPSQNIRDFGVKLKFNVVRESVRGKRVIVVDDSLVRGTTSRKIVKMLRQAGATEIHMRLSSPPVVNPCFYGMDFPTRQELIAATHSLEEIATYLRVDSVAYLSVDGMRQAMPDPNHRFCDACFTGNYPVEFQRRRELAERRVDAKEIEPGAAPEEIRYEGHPGSKN
jgi:amidophosphoribosyltransferase